MIIFFVTIENWEAKEILNSLQFTRGLKYFLNGFQSSQDEISKFITKCKNSENEQGFLTQNFFDLYVKNNIFLKTVLLQKKFLEY